MLTCGIQCVRPVQKLLQKFPFFIVLEVNFLTRKVLKELFCKHIGNYGGFKMVLLSGDLHIYRDKCGTEAQERHYTAISSPKQSGRLSAFSTFKSRAAPSAPPTASPCPKLSRSSLSSVFDSYSDPIPDSLNRSSSRAPRTCSPSGE